MSPKPSPKVLIIEDDDTLLQMYRLKFEREGFEVLSAIDGEAGIGEAVGKKPDVILLDIIMPKVDGFAVLKQLKGDPKTKAIPVILLTNLGQTEDVKKGRSLGADDYLIKASFTPAQVVAKVRDTIAGKRKTS